VINLIFIGESYLGGMAGSKRIQNIIHPFLEDSEFTISNLVFIPTGQPKTIIPTDSKVKIEQLRYSSNPITLFVFFWKGVRYLRKSKISKTKNVLYCYDTPNILTYPFLLFAKWLGYKTIVDIVEDYSLVDKQKLRFVGKAKLAFQNRILKSISSYCNGVIALSFYLKKHMEDIVKNRVPVFYFPITVNMNNFYSATPVEKQKIKLFYGGSFGHKDGVLLLLQVFERLATKFNNVDLILTGKPPKAGMKEVEDFLQNTSFKDRIHYLGYLNDKEYYETMRQCDVFLATRINSEYANAGFPFKLGEMLATGKPVVTTKVGDINKYLTHKVNAMVVEPGSFDEIYNAIEFLILNPESQVKIGLLGKEVAEENFDAHKKASDLKKFIEAI